MEDCGEKMGLQNVSEAGGGGAAPVPLQQCKLNEKFVLFLNFIL